MIEMSCPRCGAGGRVPRDKMNARLVCKKCLQVFHLTLGGQAVIGEPPPPKNAPKHPSKERAPRERIELDLSSLEGLGKAFAKIRLPDAKVLGGIAVILAVVGIVYWIFSRESVESRSHMLAIAIAKGDVGTIMQLSVPETVKEAMSWSTDIYTQYNDLKMSLGGQDPGLQIQVQRSPDGKSAQALVVFSRQGAHFTGRVVTPELDAPKPTKSGKDSIEIVFYWVPDTLGNWRLDAKRTAESSPRNL